MVALVSITHHRVIALSPRVTVFLVALMLLHMMSVRGQNAETPTYRVTYILYGEAYGQGQIWTMNPDGSEQQIFSDLSSVQPNISPDGEYIAYIGNEIGSDEERVWDLYIVSVSTGEVHTLVSQQPVTNISWSPDGKRLVFYNFAWDDLFRSFGNLIMVDADGANPTLLASDQQLFTAPVWSPDGSTILFASRDDDVETLYAVDTDGTNLRALHSDIPCFICDAPRWTLDGQFIVYMDYPDIFRMDATCVEQPQTCDTATQRISSFSGVYNAIDVSYARYGKPVYSIASDSSFLVYTFGYRFDGGGIDIARMSFDSAGWENRQVLLHGDFSIYGAMLSPDDTTIFFTDEKTIYRMNVDGSQLTPLLQGNLYGFLPVTN